MNENQNPFEQYSEEDRAYMFVLLCLLMAMTDNKEFQGEQDVEERSNYD